MTEFSDEHFLEMAHDNIKLGHISQEINIGVNAKLMNRPGIQFYSGWDHFILYGGLVVGLIISIIIDWWGTYLLCSPLIFLYGSRVILYRVEDKAREYALLGYIEWCQLWNAGGLSIRRGDKTAYSPNDPWMVLMLTPEDFISQKMSY